MSECIAKIYKDINLKNKNTYILPINSLWGQLIVNRILYVNNQPKILKFNQEIKTIIINSNNQLELCDRIILPDKATCQTLICVEEDMIFLEHYKPNLEIITVEDRLLNIIK